MLIEGSLDQRLAFIERPDVSHGRLQEVLEMPARLQEALEMHARLQEALAPLSTPSGRRLAATRAAARTSPPAALRPGRTRQNRSEARAAAAARTSPPARSTSHKRSATTAPKTSQLVRDTSRDASAAKTAAKTATTAKTAKTATKTKTSRGALQPPGGKTHEAVLLGLGVGNGDTHTDISRSLESDGKAYQGQFAFVGATGQVAVADTDHLGFHKGVLRAPTSYEGVSKDLALCYSNSVLKPLLRLGLDVEEGEGGDHYLPRQHNLGFVQLLVDEIEARHHLLQPYSPMALTLGPHNQNPYP